jgi:hypothetical protein
MGNIRTELVLCMVLALGFVARLSDTAPLVDKVITDCELEALSVGTRLADRYNMYDEQTEWDTRIHNDYVVQRLGFAGWIQMGTYKNTKLTAEKQDAPALHRVGVHEIVTWLVDA